MRDLSPETLEEIFARYNPSALVMLLRFRGVDNQNQVQEFFYVNNWEPVESNGQVYQPAGFTSNLAADSEDGMPEITLVVPAADTQVLNQLRVFDKAPTVFSSVVVAERPNIVEYPETEFKVKNWTAAAGGIRITLETEPVLNEPISGDIITPTLHPLLWQKVVIRESE